MSQRTTAGERAPVPARKQQPPVPSPGPAAPFRSPVLSPWQVLALQRGAGNRAVARTVALQRRAFVGAKPLPAGTILDAPMTKLASDDLVHDYVDTDEFRRHAAGQTDHLGNLPGPASAGTWVRFEPRGLNLVGENHTKVTLADVLGAVGSRSFVYEPFAADDLADSPHLRSAYEQASAPLFARFGLVGAGAARPHGAESLYPKMATAMRFISTVVLVEDPANVSAYSVQAAQRYLPMVWGHLQDLAARPEPAEGAVKELWSTYRDHRTVLDPLVGSLGPDRSLGDALRAAQPAVPAALKDLCDTFVSAMLTRRSSDPLLDPAARHAVATMPSGPETHRGRALAKWRTAHLAAAVHRALTADVRYLGMGASHLTELADALPAGIHLYDLEKEDLERFEATTRQLRETVPPPAGSVGPGPS